MKHDYVHQNRTLVTPSLNSTLLYVLCERLYAKSFTIKPQLFSDIPENNDHYTRKLILRSIQNKSSNLPLGLEILKSSPYLMYLLNYNEQQKPVQSLTDLERHLCQMLFPRWEFLVFADGDDNLFMLLLPKSEGDLFLLNTDLNSLMHDLIAEYSINNIDQGVPIYEDCRSVMENLLDELENQNDDKVMINGKVGSIETSTNDIHSSKKHS